jgi:hypothetical protein
MTVHPFELVGAILKLRDVLANVVVNDVTATISLPTAV